MRRIDNDVVTAGTDNRSRLATYRASRRDFLKVVGIGVGAGVVATAVAPGYTQRAVAAVQAGGLSDPALQPKFVNPVPNALDPSFTFFSPSGRYTVAVQEAVQHTGLVGPDGVTPVSTKVWGYGINGPGGTWPGMTFVARSGSPIEVKWQNKLPIGPYLITGKDNTAEGFGDYSTRPVVDTNVHWAYSLPGYQGYTIEQNGPPIVPHLHGGHNDFLYDGNPEFFFSPGYTVRGPQWLDKKFVYDMSQPAGTLWYHDHALGITRLNVYAGLAGFFIVRDADDTGRVGNALDLPAFPYEAALAIQDRMFKADGELFYPAFPGDPYYSDFITGEGASLPGGLFQGGGPTALAEFFGDHMLVNGQIWPKMDVEPRHYRLRLLNGCDSRFLAIQLFEVPLGATDLTYADGPLDFMVVGSDQGIASSPTAVDTLLLETGSRYDVVVDFTAHAGKRLIMRNIGGDEPFGGDIPGPQVFGETDRIMAFDVTVPLDLGVADVSPVFAGYAAHPALGIADRTRKVALFEGKDEFGRLQPLLGTAEPATDYAHQPIEWPTTDVYQMAKLPDGTPAPLVGPMQGSIAWHSPTTENPALDTTEQWEVWNTTGDAHPVHLHLVHFEIVGRYDIRWDSATTEEERVLDGEDDAAGDGTYLVRQPTVQHKSIPGVATTYGSGFRIVAATKGGAVDPESLPEYVENAPKDMVTALPGQVTVIKARFDKPGRYVWHCHILSHEDHEMMRVLHVGPGA